MLDFDVLICIYIRIACITSSIDLLYLIRTSWLRWIIFTKENLILLICPFCFNIRLDNCLQVRQRSSILTGCFRNSKKLCSNAPIEHFARVIGAVKWHPYNVEAKLISFAK